MKKREGSKNKKDKVELPQLRMENKSLFEGIEGFLSEAYMKS